MPSDPTQAPDRPESARAHDPPSVVGSPRGCPVCGTALRGRQSCCSGRCRAALSRRRRVPLRLADAHTIRRRIETALGLLAEARAILAGYRERG